MNTRHAALLTLLACGLSVGQVLFKLTAQRQSAAMPGLRAKFFSLLTDPVFIIAILLYMSVTLYWIWLLSFIPLSRAYAFTALSLVFTALGGVVFFHEPLSLRFAVGTAVIMLGLAIITVS